VVSTAGPERFLLRHHRQPLTASWSASRPDGAAPVFAQAIRAKIEAMIPQGFARWAEGGAALARGREVVGPLVRRAAALLAIVHWACGRQP